MILEREDAIRVIRNYYNKTLEDEHGRFMSWRHCYNVFRENRNKTDDETLDYLALHLAFYLASWGMYRGSSFLLQKDYKVHKDAVLEMQKEKYNILRSATPEQLISKDSLKAIEELHEKLQEIYLSIKKTVTESKTSIPACLVYSTIFGKALIDDIKLTKSLGFAEPLLIRVESLCIS